MPQYPFQTSETYTPDLLIAGETQVVTRSYTLAGGQVYQRGTVVGMITANGKLTLSATAASDGSQTPFGIVADTYDATAGDLSNCAIYEKGEFNENVLIYGAGWTLTTLHAALRPVGLYTKPVVAQSGQYA